MPGRRLIRMCGTPVEGVVVNFNCARYYCSLLRSEENFLLQVKNMLRGEGPSDITPKLPLEPSKLYSKSFLCSCRFCHKFPNKNANA